MKSSHFYLFLMKAFIFISVKKSEVVYLVK